jgi:hypothetical protein
MSRPTAWRHGKPRQQPAEPSWLTILATTYRLWRERRARHPDEDPEESRRHDGARKPASSWRRVRLAILAVVVLAAAGAGALLTRSSPKDAREPGRASPVLTAQADRAQAAGWIVREVSRGAIVSCDPVMCSALQALGLPASNLDVLRPGTPDPLASDVIAATSVLRSQFGARLTSVYAPVILAKFGSGSAEVDVRAVAPDGAAAYLSQFRADAAARKADGAQLLHDPGVVAAPAATGPLSAGMVDSRLLVTIATLAHLNRLHVVAFGDASPGGAAIPLRAAVLYAGSGGSPASLAALRTFLSAQQPPYLPAATQVVPVAGHSALRIEFAAPGPLGLLGTGHPVVKIASAR